MALNNLAHHPLNLENKFPRRVLVLLIAVFLNAGCSQADPPGVYRESKDKVVSYVVDPADRVVRIARFIRLQDGSIIWPTMYYYQFHKTTLGGRMVERIHRTFVSLGRDQDAKYRVIYLPTSEEIAAHLLLVRTSFPEEVDEKGNPKPKTKYKWADWQLLEIPANELSPNKPIIIPSYEELANRELSEDEKKLLIELRKQYEKIETEAWKRAGTPRKPGDKIP